MTHSRRTVLERTSFAGAAIAGAGTLAGRVTGGSGGPIGDATLTVDGEAVSIDADGAFDHDVAHGRHEVEASAPGYESRRGTVTVRFGRTTSLPVMLSGARNSSNATTIRSDRCSPP